MRTNFILALQLCAYFSVLVPRYFNSNSYKVVLSQNPFCKAGTPQSCFRPYIDLHGFTLLNQAPTGKPGFLKLILCGRLYVCIFVCMSTPRLLITSGIIWMLYDWLNKFYSFYAAAVFCILSRHALSIYVYRENHPNNNTCVTTYIKWIHNDQLSKCIIFKVFWHLPLMVLLLCGSEVTQLHMLLYLHNVNSQNLEVSRTSHDHTHHPDAVSFHQVFYRGSYVPTHNMGIGNCYLNITYWFFI